ncbi:hypothetical protein K1T71_006207 [Dendrolimus kikuchii]|uniref:Uncharacterized protein n=1 Tax=Dendrolimus kikuchii TaxID=765133 RepID=A0ACC1D364_9NEOP|nr:hypothetical protein K1T71_006207 [Dendrolimus kikuchii]
MRPEEIESILKRLENGEISEDDSTDNEDDIDYYSSQRDRLMELEGSHGNFNNMHIKSENYLSGPCVR